MDREIGPRGLAKQTCEQEAALLCSEIEGRKKSLDMRQGGSDQPQAKESKDPTAS